MPTIIVEYEDTGYIPVRGVILNSHWSDAFGCWMLLISTEDGMLRSVKSDPLGLSTHWVDDSPSIVFVDDEDDDEDGYIDEDEG